MATVVDEMKQVGAWHLAWQVQQLLECGVSPNDILVHDEHDCFGVMTRQRHQNLIDAHGISNVHAMERVEHYLDRRMADGANL